MMLASDALLCTTEVKDRAFGLIQPDREQGKARDIPSSLHSSLQQLLNLAVQVLR